LDQDLNQDPNIWTSSKSKIHLFITEISIEF